jgi:hypothetical protein
MQAFFNNPPDTKTPKSSLHEVAWLLTFSKAASGHSIPCLVQRILTMFSCLSQFFQVTSSAVLSAANVGASSL